MHHGAGTPSIAERRIDTRARGVLERFSAVVADVPQHPVDLSNDELRQGQELWATVDSPWLHKVDPAAYRKDLDTLVDFSPEFVLSCHLPAVTADTLPQTAATLETAPAAERFMGPDQRALGTMLA